MATEVAKQDHLSFQGRFFHRVLGVLRKGLSLTRMIVSDFLSSQ